MTGSDSSSNVQFFPAPQIFCSGTGSTINSSALTSMGTCTIPAATLAAGDRIDIRFDVQHSGSSGGFGLELHWGGTAILHRDAAAPDLMATVRADAGLGTSGAQLSFQSWGTVLPLGAGVGSASDNFNDGLSIDFQAMVAQAADTVRLINYAVVKY